MVSRTNWTVADYERALNDCAERDRQNARLRLIDVQAMAAKSREVRDAKAREDQHLKAMADLIQAIDSAKYLFQVDESPALATARTILKNACGN